MRDLRLSTGLTRDRLEERRQLMSDFDTLRRDLDTRGELAGMDTFTGAGVTEESDLPLTWGGRTNENVLWKVATNGLGNSSPIVCGDRVSITGSKKLTRQEEESKSRNTSSTATRWPTAAQGGAPPCLRASSPPVTRSMPSPRR